MSNPSNHPNPSQSTPDFAGKAKSLAGSLASRGKAAAQLVAKQAERTKLANVNLPAAYQALGKHLYDTGQLRSNLPDPHRVADKLLGDIQAIQGRATGQPSAEGIAAKAKAAAKATADMAQVKTLQVRFNHALGELGKAAIERFGDDTGPAELIRPITELRSRLVSLDQEIADLSKATPGQILTPKRIAFVGAVCVVFVVFLLGRSFMGGSKSASSGSGGKETGTPWRNPEEAHRKELPGILKKCVALADTDPDGAAELLGMQMVSLSDEEAIAEAMADMPKDDQKKLAEIKRRAKDIWQKRGAEARVANEEFQAKGGWSQFDPKKEKAGPQTSESENAKGSDSKDFQSYKQGWEIGVQMANSKLNHFNAVPDQAKDDVRDECRQMVAERRRARDELKSHPAYGQDHPECIKAAGIHDGMQKTFEKAGAL